MTETIRWGHKDKQALGRPGNMCSCHHVLEMQLVRQAQAMISVVMPCS